jgi:hypothetical protein
VVIEFKPWPKIARLNRDIVITEKIDGTNAAIIIEPTTDPRLPDENAFVVNDGEHWWKVGAQSRTRLITPRSDNFGFARWVYDNAPALADLLGPGYHFGEWWGAGIQRRYGLDHKRFSLFNTHRWGFADLAAVPQLDVVPILYSGPFSDFWIERSLDALRNEGSLAAPAFKDPEGIVIHHHAANQMFKVTLVGDEAPKGAAA